MEMQMQNEASDMVDYFELRLYLKKKIGPLNINISGVSCIILRSCEIIDWERCMGGNLVYDYIVVRVTSLDLWSVSLWFSFSLLSVFLSISSSLCLYLFLCLYFRLSLYPFSHCLFVYMASSLSLISGHISLSQIHLNSSKLDFTRRVSVTKGWSLFLGEQLIKGEGHLCTYIY